MHFDAIEDFERELGLPSRWYFSLMSEPEHWSFIVKVHALFEAALPHAIEAQVQPDGLKTFVSGLSVGGQFGKLTLAHAVGVLDAKQMKFVRLLLSLRNRCVHDVRNVTFDLDEYFVRLDAREQCQFMELVQDHFAALEADGKTPASRDEFIRGNLKFVVWLVASKILAELYNKRELARQISQMEPSSGFSDSAFGEVGFSE